MRKLSLLLLFPFFVFAGEQLSFIFVSKYTLDETVNKLQNSIKAANYKVYKPKKLLEDLLKNPHNSKQAVIRFCNFENMQKFLKIEPKLGVLLPCRITVLEDDNKQIKVVIENYLNSIKYFNNPELVLNASILIKELKNIIEEALW